ncbi:MAG: S8/S53 family peptidase, partial [Chloroflexota bacterium]|nr:S8/S53 family peptidase [Chloroflexota bacterium]
MPGIHAARGILVKARPLDANRRLAVDGGDLEFDARPLFPSIDASSSLGVGARTVWQVLEPRFALSEQNAWDVCHQLLARGFGVDGSPPPEFAEPDFEQHWQIGPPLDTALALAGGCQLKQQDSHFPTHPDPLWFKDASHGQFRAALDVLGEVSAGEAVRVAHLDTGYDRQHAGLPARLNHSLERNFVEADRPTDASDSSVGPLASLGHGTGTLGVLASGAVRDGVPIGAAPFVEVVPLRVANSVVLFYTSGIASALDYVYALCTNAATRVDVVTMSMGGLASQAWAEAVNALYEAGVFVVTAAGNNLGNLPTRQIVFPARFKRVIAACGVMANFQPYADLSMNLMAGNYGPSDKMDTALSGYTPNIPWATFGCSELINPDGAGTSCATPQVAAAAAIWIQRHRSAWGSYSENWMRVEAVRRALFTSARDLDRAHLGRGAVAAADALLHAPEAESALRPQPPDSASFPIWRLLFGVGANEELSPRQRMLELEALQLSQAPVE